MNCGSICVLEMVYPRNLKGHTPLLHEHGTCSMNESWKRGTLEQNGFKCLSAMSHCLTSHIDTIVYTIGLVEVRMYFMNCLAGLQIVEKGGVMGPTAQYKLGVESVLARHRLKMSEIFCTCPLVESIGQM